MKNAIDYITEWIKQKRGLLEIEIEERAFEIIWSKENNEMEWIESM